MHCCLITAPTVTEFRSRGELLGDAVQLAATQPQLGILSVAAVLETCGDRPEIIDANSEYLRYVQGSGQPQPDGFADHIAELAVRSNADLYGFSSICSTYPLSIRIARAVKMLRPYSMVLFGGPQASVVDTATVAAFPFVDFVLRGEVELTLPALLEELQRDYEYSRVGGLTYREGISVKRNPNAPIIEDLDMLPPPAYHLSNYLLNARAASIELGRGCPFSCTFCSTNDFFRRKFRLRSPGRVLREMREIASVYGLRHFELVHDMFTVDRRRVVAFCEEMLAANEGFTWDCSARTDCVDRDLLELMSVSGCRNVFFGIETGSPRMQRVIDKDLDIGWALQVLQITQQLGLTTTVSLITGFPEEEWPDVRDTVQVFTESARHSASHPQLNLLAPLAGTPIHAAHKEEMVLEELCSDMSHQGLTQSQQDLELIRKFPDIFPNFYLIPTPALDRNVLFDLREFLSMAVECYRWVLCAIDQATNMLSFHQEWREWRQNLRGNLVGSDLRRYYVGKLFRKDFLAFVRDHKIVRNPSVRTLVAAETVLETAAAERRPSPQSERHGIDIDELLCTVDVPYRVSTTQIVHLEYKIQHVISSLATRTELPPSGAASYATRVDKEGSIHLVEISSAMAYVIELCNGNRNVGTVMDSLAANLTNVDEPLRRHACMRLLAGAQVAGFVTMSIHPDRKRQPIFTCVGHPPS